jgi:serine protease Do
MNLKPLSAALVGAGIAVVGTAGAIDLPSWLKHDTQVAAAPQQLAPAEKLVPPAPLPAVPGQVPNYRAIVKQAAPAVVGITVEGMHKASAEEAKPGRHGPIRSSSSSAAAGHARAAGRA